VSKDQTVLEVGGGPAGNTIAALLARGVFRNVAIWGYWDGGAMLPGTPEGGLDAVSAPDGWYWVIPLADNRFSVGYVTHRDISARDVPRTRRWSTWPKTLAAQSYPRLRAAAHRSRWSASARLVHSRPAIHCPSSAPAMPSVMLTTTLATA
jgi:flavin-dependent dehydrogenase